MYHSDQVRGSGRVHVAYIVMLALCAALFTLVSTQFAGAVANAQSTVTGTKWQNTLVIPDAHSYSLSRWSPWSPDGSKLVAASDDNTVGVWDATTGAKLATLTGHTDHVRSPAWSPDGSKIASASRDGTVRVWDATTGASLATLISHYAEDVAWSPDSSKLASSSGLADGIIKVWDATTGAELATLTGHTHYLQSLAWSPDGSKLASASSDQTVRIWDVVTGANLVTITNENSLGTHVVWSSDGTWVASGFQNDGAIGVWDARTGENKYTLTGHTDTVEGLAWLGCAIIVGGPCQLASASDDGTVQLWDLNAPNPKLATLTGHTSGVGIVVWSPDGSKLASVSAQTGGDEAVRVWDAATGTSLAALTGHTGTVSNLAWSPDGSKLASEGDGTVRVWAAAAASAPTSTPAAAATPASAPTATPDPNAIAFEPASLEFVWVKGSRSSPDSKPVLARNVGGVEWSTDSWVTVPGRKWVPGGLQMNVSVSPANANLDVGVHEGQVTLTDKDKGVTITLPVKVTVVSADGTLQVNRKQLNFGGFVGDPIADQTVGLTFTGLNSANWTATGPSWLTLTPASGSVSATAPTDLTVGIDAAAISGAGKNTGTLTVSDGKTTHEIAVELSLVAPGSPTIQLYALEVTQGLQNLLNDIPFVANRPVFVRGHVRSLTGSPIEKVTAQLTGTRDGAALGTLDPSNPGGSINIVANPDRAQLDQSFLFELPESWRTGTVTLQLVGKSQPIACVDPAEKSSAGAGADDCTVTLTYETVPVMPITYFLYKDVGEITRKGVTTGNYTFEATAAHASGATRAVMAGLPLSGVDEQINSTVLTYPGGIRRTTSDVNKALDEIYKLYKQAGEPARHYYGLFARYPTTSDPDAWSKYGPGGLAVLGGFHGVGEFATDQAYGLLNAHEFGHNFDRPHAPCGPADNTDPSFPHPNGQISNVLSGNEAYFGFNIFSKAIYPPTHKDLMTYCWPQWISPYTYKAIIERLKIHYNTGAGGSGSGGSGASPSGPILLVSGSIAGPTAGSIDSVVDDDANAPIPAPGASEYSVRLEDASGQTIATYPVTPLLAEGQSGEELTSYTLAAPRPENLARAVLLYQTEELAERVASATAPTLTLTSPVGGESFGSQPLSIAWDASDADGDALTFNVDYSIDDGATWQKLAWDWPETVLEVDSSQLPGSAEARLRVSANDGFLTTFAESDTFAVADRAPVAIILSTDLNRYYVGGQTILLQGTGYDAEDGAVGDLTWYSDRDGVLGTGPSLALNADDLAEGTHLIRLEAKDSTGQSSFGDPTLGIVSVEGFAAVNDTVSFDVLYDPLTLPAALAVAPDLGFATRPGSTQLLTDTLTVSNLGDGALGWTASSDSAKVVLSSSSGDTPATVVVTVNPAGLAQGLYEGVLTFTPSDDSLEPVTINYFINVYPWSFTGNAYAVESLNLGADEAPWLDAGVWVIGGQPEKQVVALDIASSDSGQTLTGTMTYAGEGPIGVRATRTERNVYWIETQWGGADMPWNVDGTWMLGDGDEQNIVALNLLSEDDGETLDGQIAYADGGLFGLRATLQPTYTWDSPAASPAPAQAERFPVLPGQTIERGQKIPSESGDHYLIFQPDGNVVVYAADDQYVWGLQSITDQYQQSQSVQVESDGNFVVRDANDEVIWSALTENSDPSAYLTLTPEGVLQLVSGDTDAILWASDGGL